MKIVTISAVWCPSCLIMRPRFEEVETKFTNIESKSFDIDLDEESSMYNPGHILPIFILLDENNIELGRLVGEQKKETLISFLESHIKVGE